MDNPFVHCPYNRQHRMLKLRLQHHIVRCPDRHFNKGMKPCPYNATHIIPQEDYRTHIESCPDVRLIEGDRYNDDEVMHGHLNDGAFHFDVIQDEDWEPASRDTDSSSQVSDKETYQDLCGQFDLDDDYDEDDEPLNRYFYEMKKSETTARMANETASISNIKNSDDKPENITSTSTDKNLKDNDSWQASMTPQFGMGRGRLLQILASIK